MISIGELSRLCRVSTKTLRHYDKIGLIKPVYVNDENGYRYYDVTQNKDIAFISKMKNYGFSLIEINQLIKIDDNLELVKVLEKRRVELDKELFVNQYYLKSIIKDIELIERGIKFMSNEYKISIVEKEAFNIVSVRRLMGIKDFDKAFGDLFALIEKNKYTVIGAPLAFYHSEDFDPENTDIETGCPVLETAGEGIRHFEPSKCCMTTFVGPYIDFSPAYIALESWVKENGYEVGGSPFEVYTKGMDSGILPEQFETEIYIPIKK